MVLKKARKAALYPIRKTGRFVQTTLQRSFLRKPLLGLGIFLNNLSYKIIKKFLKKPGEMHPKHEILKYPDFFKSHISKTETVIDIGCGNGVNAAAVAPVSKKVVGIDLIPTKIKQAKHLFPHTKYTNLSFVVGDATTFDYSTLGIASFDKIILSNVLEHIKHRVPFLKKLKKVSPVILLRVPMLTRDWLTVYKKKHGYEYRLDPTHETEFTLEQLQNELARAGWKVQEHEITFGEFWGVVITK